MKIPRKAANWKTTSKPEYEIGYGKPPIGTRFKSGQSGNPRGRPKGEFVKEEKLKAIILNEAYRTIKVNEPSGQLTISMAEAVLRSLSVNAAKGKTQAQKLFIELVAAVEGGKKDLNDQLLEAAIKYKADWECELAYRRRHGIMAPDPVPHPDDIQIDLHTGTVRFVGPMTKEEKILESKVEAAATERIEASSHKSGTGSVKRLRLSTRELSDFRCDRTGS